VKRRVGSLEERFQLHFCPRRDEKLSKYSKSTEKTNTRPAAITTADRQKNRYRTGIAEVTGSNPVEALIFSGFFFPIA